MKTKGTVIERWVPVLGYEGKYTVSDKGRVYSLLSFRYLKPQIQNRGYTTYGLHKNSKKIAKKAHRLVYEGFIGAIKDGYQINHINGIKDDNCIDNLEEVSPRENVQHYVSGNVKKSSRFCGVTHHLNGWQAQITTNGKQKYIGWFKTEIEAARAYVTYTKENNIANKYAAKHLHEGITE